MLTLEQITIAHSEKALLQGVSLSLLQGCAIIVQGHNGIGKTSLLKTIAGLRPPAHGAVYYKQVNIQNALAEYHQLLAFIGHGCPLKEQLSVAENMRYWARVYNHELCLDAAMHCLGLTEWQHQPVKSLSQGWRQRVKLSRLLLINAKLWLLDEPTINLDQQGVQIFQQLVDVHTSHGGMAVIATNNSLKFARMGQLMLEDFA